MAKYNFTSPQAIHKSYNDGLVGAIPDPAGSASLKEEIATRYGSNKFQLAHLEGYGDDKIVLHYEATRQYDPKAYEEENQTTGDCVSHATRNAVQTTASVEAFVKKEPEIVPKRFATENIYGDRGHTGPGASCPRLAKYVMSKGGILLRQDYPELGINLSKYNASIGIRWGGRGVPDKVNQEASKHQITNLIVPKSVQEVKDLIAAGYAASACSGMGFSSQRDENGIARQTGSWAHAMTIIAGDDSRQRLDEYLVLIANSWGNWNSGPKVHNQPNGSFWIRESVLKRYLSSGQITFFSSFNGWPAIIPPKGYKYSFT